MVSFRFADHANTGADPFPARPQPMGQELVGKRGYRSCFVIHYVEDGVELSDLQYVMDLLVLQFESR
jgi:hypothetical protein